MIVFQNTTAFGRSDNPADALAFFLRHCDYPGADTLLAAILQDDEFCVEVRDGDEFETYHVSQQRTNGGDDLARYEAVEYPDELFPDDVDEEGVCRLCRAPVDEPCDVLLPISGDGGEGLSA